MQPLTTRRRDDATDRAPQCRQRPTKPGIPTDIAQPHAWPLPPASAACRLVCADAEPPAPIDPEELALLEPAEARARIAALSPAQRLAQARAQAAWLASFGYPVTPDEVLAVWEAGIGGGV